MINSNDRDTLYIPVGLKTKTEIFDGFGKDELYQTIIATLIAGVVDVFLFLITRKLPLCVLFILVAIAGNVMIFTKDAINLSVVDHLKNMIKFHRSQKKYPYIIDKFGLKK